MESEHERPTTNTEETYIDNYIFRRELRRYIDEKYKGISQSNDNIGIWVSFVNSDLGKNLITLAVGFFLSGITLSYFQNAQRKVEWKKQIKYDMLKSEVSTLKSGYKDLSKLYYYSQSVNVLIKSISFRRDKNFKHYDKDLEKIESIQNSIFNEHSKLYGYLINFENKKISTSQDFVNYFNTVDDLFDIYKKLLKTLYDKYNKAGEKNHYDKQLAGYSKAINTKIMLMNDQKKILYNNIELEINNLIKQGDDL